MRSSPFWWVFIGFMLLLDIYVFQAIKMVSQPANSKLKMVIFSGYWLISVSAIVLLLLLPYLNFTHQEKLIRNTLFATIAGLFFAKLIGASFFLIDDFRRGVQWVAGKIFFSNTEGEGYQEGEKISRSVFLSWAGIAAGAGLFGSLVYGFNNKYRYQLKRLNLSFERLPEAFRGLRIIHISDIHSGSFTDREAVMKGIRKIQDQNPDLILFTGDLVNNKAEEMEPFREMFSTLNATHGVYSVLGNHDYGDYVSWSSEEEKTVNLEKLKKIHADMGWQLLMNEKIVIEKNNQQISVLGIENWSSKARFPKYGNLSKAYEGTDKNQFKILLSHDPSHWDAEVRTQYQDIDLMLSGHTHGMQFGVEIPGFKWSPVQYVYKQWAGLYQEGNQKLYVNRGFGFIGYPGRVGILPEITVIELT